MAQRPSKSQLDKAGRVIRTWLPEALAEAARRARDTGRIGEVEVRVQVPDEVTAAFDAIYDYQASYADALAVIEPAFTEVVAVVDRGSAEGIVGRPKRMASILSKLFKLTARLTQIEDLWGFRTVVPDQSKVYAVLEGLLTRWPDAHVDDYVERPQSTGYRAIHVVVTEDGVPVELQLRTPRQNEWADTVERTGDRLGFNFPGKNLKDGEGPAELVDYFRQAAYRIALEERGDRPDEASERDFELLREQVRPYFERQSNGK
jgi:ppGpp synthetase/RelA/SpoT-type nucleotidyltranferase